MRTIGLLHPSQDFPLPPDTVQTLLIAASSGQALDWPTTQVDFVRFTAVTTAGAQLNCFVNLTSTKAAAPTSGPSTEGASGFVIGVLGTAQFQVPGASTGWSVAALSSGYVTAQVWSRAR